MEQGTSLREDGIDRTQPLGGVVGGVSSSHSQSSNNIFSYPVVQASNTELQLQTKEPVCSTFEGKDSYIAFPNISSEVLSALQASETVDSSVQAVESGSPTHKSHSNLLQNNVNMFNIPSETSVTRDPSEMPSSLHNPKMIESSILQGSDILGQHDSSQQHAASIEEHRMVEEVPNVSNRSLRTKRSFTTEFKLECVEHAERTKNKTKTAKLFNVNRRRVQEWCTQKERLMSVPRQQKRLSGGGRRQIPMSSSPLMIAENESGGVENKEEGAYIEEAPHSFGAQVQVPTVDPAFVDFIVQNLPSMDFSTLPSSMIKVFQDWSKLTAHGVKMPPIDESIPTTEKGVEMTSVSESVEKEILGKDGPVPSIEEEIKEPANPLPQQVSEQCDTEDEIDVGEPMDMGPLHVLANDLSKSANRSEAGSTFDVHAPSEAPTGQCKEGNGEHLGGLEGGVPENIQGSMTANSSEAGCEASQIDSKVNIDLSSITNWIHENAMDNVPAILDALMQAQAASSKSIPGDLNEETMEAALSTDDFEGSQIPGKRSAKSLPRARVKNRYSLEFKLDCIAHAESTSKCAAAREFNVDRRRVQDWCSKKDQLRKMVQVNSQAVVKLSRERIDSDVEQELVAWVKFQQDAGVVLNRKMLGEEATKLYHEKGETDFVSSVGWVAKFMVRNNISLVGRSLRINLPPETESTASS